jgi:TolB protein
MNYRIQNILAFLCILPCFYIAPVSAQSTTQTNDKASIYLTRVFPNPGQLHLYVADADGENKRPLLANQDTDYNATWSADEQWIVFTSERAGSTDLFRVRPDGSALQQLTDHPAYDDQASLSPDGRQIVFATTRVDGTTDLAILELESTQTRMLTSGQGGDFRPTWSPDGNWIAFSSDRGKGLPFSQGRWEALHLVDIYLIRPDGSGLRQLTDSQGFCGSPAWTADSREVLASCMSAQETLDYRNNPPPENSSTDLIAIDIASGAMRELSSDPGLKYSPKALTQGIAYRTPGGIIYNGGGRGPQGPILAAAWSPDGGRVVYHEIGPPEGLGANGAELFSPAATRRRPDSGDQAGLVGTELWTPADGYELKIGGMQPSFDPSGQRIAMANLLPPPLINELAIIDAVSNEWQVIFQHPELQILGPQWTNEGNSLVFAVGSFAGFFGGLHPVFVEPGDRAEGGARIATINADGSGYRELSSGADNNAFPSASPDGSRFVYRTFGQSGETGLRLYDLESETSTVLTTGYDNFPLWSPRGDLIMFSRLVDGNNYEIFTIEPDGSNELRLTNAVGNDAHQGWSPDGEFIVFAGSQKGFKDEFIYTPGPQPYGEIYVMRFDGSGLVQLTDNQWEEGTPAWRP